MNNSQDILVLEKLTGVLDRLKIAYVIGGSLASSAYGVVRFTQDVDITVDFFMPVADQFFEVIKDDFYISREAMYQALQNRGNFNIIHFATAFKIDIFISTEDEFHKQMFSRCIKLKLSDSSKTFVFVSPEDIILLKLDWYRQSGDTSDRQWSDIIGVLTAQADSLDNEYLRKWAAKLGVEDLLQRATKEKKT